MSDVPSEDPPFGNFGVDLANLKTVELMALHRATLYTLYEKGIVRTLNAPQGDWAELLVATAYQGTLAPNSEKSYDVLSKDGRRLQVKARALRQVDVGSQATSPFRTWGFDAAVIVLLNPEDLSVGRAAELPLKMVQEHSTYRKHVNGFVLRPSVSLMDQGIDITERLSKAAQGI